MPSISVVADVKKAKRNLTRQQRKQIPYALKNTLNDLAFEGRSAEQHVLEQHLNRPKSFTKKGFRVIKAKKYVLESVIYIPANRWKYMKYQVEGGTSTGLHVVPFHARLDKWGALGRNKARRLLARKDTFSGTIKGIPGIWQRTKAGGVKLLAAYEHMATYRPRFPFGNATHKVVLKRFNKLFGKNLARALATARK